MEPSEKLEKIELTVISVQGLRPNICSLFSKAHLEIRAGTHVHNTTGSRGMAPHVWNEKFDLELTDSEEVSLSLYRKRVFRPPVLIGSLTVAPVLDARDQDLVKAFPSPTKGPPVTVTYRLREPERNFRDPRCPFFAFIIGIDQYLSNAIPNLRGCVNDAQTMRNFLTNRFHIPEAQIAFLANEDATRKAILEKFQTHLIDNPSIEKDDTIILYYAGHGSRTKGPDSWPSVDGKIETLVPHDERGKTSQGDAIHGIPDRTINILLSQLATAKGNNITVILDCCHSGGGTRGTSPSILPVPRFVETLLPIPDNLDRTLWASRSGHVDLPPGISYKFMHSHVLLAACRQQQRARECLSAAGEPCGFFTSSLIKALRGVGPNRITYPDLVELLPTLPDQNPQCEGANKDRFVFDVEGRGHDPETLHGVVVGTQFVPQYDVRGRKDLDSTSVAVSVALDSSVLVPIVPGKDLAFPKGTRLVVSDWKNEAAMMKVYIHSASEGFQLAESELSVPRKKTGFVVVDSLHSADLAIRRTAEEEISLTRLDARIPRYIDHDVKLNVPIHNLPYALDAVAQFNYFLGKHNAKDTLGLAVLEMYELAGEFGSRVPNTEVGNMVVDNEVRFQLDTEAKYGFAICNYSKHDLFPYLFYFDPATYSIDAWYLPESKTMTAPLPAKSGSEPTRITVGYGAGGGYAFQFIVPEGITSDTGFLKLFVSKKYLDLNRIEQPAAVDARAGGRDSASERIVLDAEIWGAVDVPVTIFTEE
ncbi:caspase domain-containing protein [Mycena galericulata]|nr:caspase domain-containing protein [Mycena galericulata]